MIADEEYCGLWIMISEKRQVSYLSLKPVILFLFFKETFILIS